MPGDHCRWCLARGTCPRLRDDALAVAQSAFGAVPSPPPPATLTVEQVVQVLNAASVVETWIDSVRAHAHKLATTGVQIPGMKLVEKRGNRRWTDTIGAESTLRSLGINPFCEPELISPAVAEKKLGKRNGGVLDQLTVRPITGTALVHESDKRPAITAGAVDTTGIFDALDS